MSESLKPPNPNPKPESLTPESLNQKPGLGGLVRGVWDSGIGGRHRIQQGVGLAPGPAKRAQET